MKIYKYDLTRADCSKDLLIVIPSEHKVLDLQIQNGSTCLWAEVNLKSKVLDYQIKVVGTGQEAPDSSYKYLGTTQEGQFVWHYYWKQL